MNKVIILQKILMKKKNLNALFFYRIIDILITIKNPLLGICKYRKKI